MSQLSELSFTFLFLIWMANCYNLSLSGKPREISSVVKNVGQLPCPVGSLEDVAMILWFKNSLNSPIYSYDARNEKEEPRHLTVKNDWGLRLYFRVWPNLRRPPALIIRDVQIIDAGVYRCRVDYRNSPTTNYVSRLQVIQPPTHLEIRDTSISRPISDQQMVPASQSSDITYMGPYEEGQNLTITCSAYGAKPLPAVMWLKNGAMIDANYDFVGDSYATNELHIQSLERVHTSDLYTCQASNNNESKAISHSVNLDVYLGVKYVDLEVPDEMTAGDEYTLICKAMGAYPTIKIEFWKMQKRIGPKYQTRSDADNVTAYNFSYKPEILDDETTISCKAENPWMNQKPLVATKIVKIKYIPVAILRFGQNKTTNFTEGESVLIECHVKANPPMFSIIWLHQKEQLYNNETTGVRINGMTLILTNLKPTSGGKYFCQAVNDVGKGISNPLVIPLYLSPKCSSSVAAHIPLAVGESVNLKCNLIAWPPDLNFYWTLNGSHDIVPILSAAMTNYSKGTFEEIIPLEEFDEYIYPGSGIMDNVELQNLMQSEGSGSGGGISHVSFGEKGSSERDSSNFTKNGTDEPRANSTQELLKLKSGNKTSPWKLSGGVVKRVHERWKTPQYGSGDNIRHQAILFYTVRSIENYGLVSCSATNSYGKQLRPCLFHIISKEEANQDEEVGDGLTRDGNLTSQHSLESVGAAKGESGIRDPSKLQTTLGIILMVLLIFIASLGGLMVFLLLLLFAKRRKQIQRMAMTSKGRYLDSEEVASSTTEKCTPSISYRRKNGFETMDPFSIVEKDSGILSSFGSCSTSFSGEPNSSSTATAITTITNSSANRSTIPSKNDFPPPPTSIISTASTSHGYGSIGEDEVDEDEAEDERGRP